MKKYDKYKDSGIEWIGEIPEYWEVKSLKYIASIVLGKMLTSTDKGGYFLKPYLRAANLNWLFVNVEDVKKMWFSNKELDTYRLKRDDLLVSEGGEVGRTCIWNEELPECYIQNSVHKITVNESCTPRYFLYHFFTLGQIGAFDLIVNRISIAHLTMEKLKEIKFITPNKVEQTAIASYLDRKTAEIDELIADKRRLLELYEEEKTVVINHAITKGINPDVKMKDSGIEWLGEIPEHWEVKKLKYVLIEKLKYGANEPAIDENLDHPRYIRITDFGNDGMLKRETFKSLPLEKAVDYILNEGDILFARSGATVGKTFQFKNYEGIACFAGYLIKATVNTSLMNSDFLYYFTKSGTYENWKSSIFNQATIQNIGADKYSILELPTPPSQEQQSIVNYIETETVRIDSKINKAEKLIELLTEYRTALISDSASRTEDKFRSLT